MQKSITKTLTLETNSTLHHDSCYCQMKESNCSLCRGHQTRSALQHESFYYQMIELNCSLCRDHQTNSTLHHESCYYQMKKSNYSLCIIICQSPKPMNCILLVSEDTTHDKWVALFTEIRLSSQCAGCDDSWLGPAYEHHVNSAFIKSS